MIFTPRSPGFAVGWDVGAWNCDKNPNSRDALVVLDAVGQRIGKPWRGNLRAPINNAANAAAFKGILLALCGLEPGDLATPMTLAIDAPLGFSVALVELLAHGKTVPEIGQSATNPYLFRQTERRLFCSNLNPLSAIKDMIGSQTTKAIHTLARFAPIIAATGVWTDGNGLLAIETYPAACEDRFSAEERARIALIADKSDDIGDAYRCALIAHRFSTAPETLEPPPDDIPPAEGWIWLPRNTAGDRL
jgi:hypothetical protein